MVFQTAQPRGHGKCKRSVFSDSWFPFPQRISQKPWPFLLFTCDSNRSTVGLFATAVLPYSIRPLNNLAKLSSKALNWFLQCSVYLNDTGVCVLFTSHSHSLSVGMRLSSEKTDHELPWHLSYLEPTTLMLIGILGQRYVQFWIGFSFFVVCLAAFLSHIILLTIILAKRSLLQPTLHLAVLEASDVGLCVATAPKMLDIFLFG